MDDPVYTQRPIQSIESLCCALGQTEGFLRSMANRIPKLYIGPMPKPKKNGNGFRNVYDTKAPLKLLLKKINVVFFRKVDFPLYLQGSLQGRDYVSNASIHQGSGVVISEDIQKFFDNIAAEQVYAIWHDFFRFGAEPAALLTALTTREGRVFQGTPTSSYLANLVFWGIEGKVVEKLAGRGIRYSRYVDDVTISHGTTMSPEDKTWAIAQIYAMVGARGFKPERSKHSVQPAHRRISVMGININQHPTISVAERAKLRSEVHRLEQLFDRSETGLEFRGALEKASGKIGRMSRFHPDAAAALRQRVRSMRSALDGLLCATFATTTFPAISRHLDQACSPDCLDAPPW